MSTETQNQSTEQPSPARPARTHRFTRIPAPAGVEAQSPAPAEPTPEQPAPPVEPTPDPPPVSTAAEVPAPKDVPDEIRVPAVEREYRNGESKIIEPVEPDYPARTPTPQSRVEMVPVPSNMAMVPVDWLEHLMSRHQIETVLERRQVSKGRATMRVVADKEPEHVPPKGSKFCAGCSKDKPTSGPDAAFYKMSSSKDGYQPRCKECQRKDAEARREAAPPTTSNRAYALSGKARATVRGRSTIKKVFEYFKKHKTVTARQLMHDLKMPPSTVHRTLSRLKKKQAIAQVPARV